MKPTIDAHEAAEFYLRNESVRATSKHFVISIYTVRRILVSQGIACTDHQRDILAYMDSGLSAAEIAKKLGVSERAVKTYLPYTKGSYSATPPSVNALRIRKSRNKNTPEE